MSCFKTQDSGTPLCYYCGKPMIKEKELLVSIPNGDIHGEICAHYDCAKKEYFCFKHRAFHPCWKCARRKIQKRKIHLLAAGT